MEKAKKISPFRLASLLRLQNDPNLAFELFLKPDPDDPNPNQKPFRYNNSTYDLIITKLGRAKMFNQMETIIEKLKTDTRIIPKEIIFCNIIQYYGRARLPHKAHKLFDEIPNFRCQVTIKSYNSLLNTLLMCKQFDKMSEVYNTIDKYMQPDACTYNILINMWISRGDLNEAGKLFDEMRTRGVAPNVVTFGTLINGLCSNSRVNEAFELKKKMVRDFKIKPNAFVYVALIKGLNESGKVDEAIKLKNEILRNKVDIDSAVYATLITGLFKSGRKDEVHELLEEMKKKGCKMDIVTYNALISGSCMDKDFDLAFKYLNELETKKWRPDVLSYNIIIRGLCKEGRFNEANELFEDMPRRKCYPDVVSYRTLFDGFCEGLKFKEAVFILDEMVFKGYLPRVVSLHKLVDGLIKEGKVELLQSFLNSLARGNNIDVEMWTRLISMVCEKEDLLNVFEVVDSMVKT